MSTTLEALAAALAAEHAAVYIYGVLGGRTSRSAEPTLAAELASAYDTHRARRDWLVSEIRDLGVEPEPSAAAYEVTHDLGSAAAVSAVALELETGTAAVCADLVAATSGDQRRRAIVALTDAAVRQLSFGGTASSFPGLGEFAGR